MDQTSFMQSERSTHSDGREVEDFEGFKNPYSKHYFYPRLFVIDQYGDGYELMTKETLEY